MHKIAFGQLLHSKETGTVGGRTRREGNDQQHRGNDRRNNLPA